MKNEGKIKNLDSINNEDDNFDLKEEDNLDSINNEDLLFGGDDLFLFRKESKKEREIINKVRMREIHIKYKDLGYTDSLLRFNLQVNLIKTLIGFLKTSMKEDEVCKILYGILKNKDDLEKQVENIFLSVNKTQ